LGRILAIDFGTKRIGLAVTDPNQIIATALDTIPSAEILDYLKNYFSKESVSKIIIGEPKHLDGSISGPIEALCNFKKALSRLFPSIPVESIDERFTSKIAFESMILSLISWFNSWVSCWRATFMSHVPLNLSTATICFGMSLI